MSGMLVRPPCLARSSANGVCGRRTCTTQQQRQSRGSCGSLRTSSAHIAVNPRRRPRGVPSRWLAQTVSEKVEAAGGSSSLTPTLAGEDAAAFDVSQQSLASWGWFFALLTGVLGLIYVVSVPAPPPPFH